MVGEADRAAVAFEGQGAVAMSALLGVVVVEHLFEGHDLQGLEDVSPAGDREQGRGVAGDGRSDHGGKGPSIRGMTGRHAGLAQWFSTLKFTARKEAREQGHRADGPHRGRSHDGESCNPLSTPDSTDRLSPSTSQARVLDRRAPSPLSTTHSLACLN